MMGATALESFANDFETSLSAQVTSSTATSITVATASGAPTSGNFRIRVNSEIMLVTAGHGTTTWTVKRGQDNTAAAASHASGSIVTHVLTATGVVNSQLQSQDWTHGGTLHYTGSSVASGSTGNPNTPTAYYSTSTLHTAQQFTLSGNAIDRVVLYIKAQTATTSGDVTVSLQTNGAGGPSGTLAGGSVALTLPGEFFTTTVRSVSIPFRATALSPGATLWIVVSRQTADTTNYLNVGYTAKAGSLLAASTSSDGTSWTTTTTTTLSFDVYAGATGSLVNSMEDDALAPWNPALTAGMNWTEMVYTSGNLSNIYEYLGSFRNTRTLTYSNGVLIGVS